MTTEQLRKEITVTGWMINSIGISIKYFRTTDKQKYDPKYIELNPEECACQLFAIGSIDSWNDDIVFSINMDGYDLNWTTFLKNFKLSQWEALTLAIRHEYELSIEQDSNMIDITNSINKLNQHK